MNATTTTTKAAPFKRGDHVLVDGQYPARVIVVSTLFGIAAVEPAGSTDSFNIKFDRLTLR